MHTTETRFARSGKRWRPARNKRALDGQKRTCETRLLTTWKFILWVCHGTKRGCQGGCYGGCTVINFDAEMTRSCTQPQSSHRYQKKQLSVWFSLVLFLASCYDADWGPLVCFRPCKFFSVFLVMRPHWFSPITEKKKKKKKKVRFPICCVESHHKICVSGPVPSPLVDLLEEPR